LARRLGATDEVIESLGRGDLASLAPGDRAAIAFAEAITPTGSTASDRVYEDLACHWNVPQIVEITAVVGLFNYFNRFAVALHVPVTR
jgi:alkylhydroperoxidase family enzyme